MTQTNDIKQAAAPPSTTTTKHHRNQAPPPSAGCSGATGPPVTRSLVRRAAAARHALADAVAVATGAAAAVAAAAAAWRSRGWSTGIAPRVRGGFFLGEREETASRRNRAFAVRCSGRTRRNRGRRGLWGFRAGSPRA